MRHAFMEHMVGKTVSVLTEEKRDEKGRYSGYSGNYLRVAIGTEKEKVKFSREETPDGGQDASAFVSPAPVVNQIYPVRILRRDGEELVGVTTEKEKDA